MLQSFTASTSPEQGPPRLDDLRAAMTAAEVQGFLVPRADAHQGEYVAERDQRLAWLTGFTGSAGFAVILPDVAGVFIDGRYRLQVRDQVADCFTPVPWPETQPAPWINQHLDQGIIAYDPWLHTVEEIARIQADLKAGIRLQPMANLVDAVWHDQPDAPREAVWLHPDDLAGETSAQKRARLGAGLADAGQSAAVITLPDSICWLLNIRGADIPRNPVVHAFAVLYADGKVAVFSDPSKYSDQVREALGPEVAICDPETFLGVLTELKGPVLLDRASAPVAVHATLQLAKIEVVWGDDPCRMPKACKTPAELAGMREVHLRDGAAMVEFLYWLDGQATAVMQGAHQTEIGVVKALEGFRRATNQLHDLSFETICGAGPNGAIVHYRVTEGTDRALTPNSLLLVDSGGQYLDGTTDITRTIVIGEAPEGAARAFTAVLEGMINLSRARWPKGLAGRDLDAIARYPLWQLGCDYDHGTGHGVGAFLSVHEGPQRFSRISEVALQPGMILSNEPGYYKEGSYGIRIENLVVVQQASAGGDAHRQHLDLETLTFAPIDRRLIMVEHLSNDARLWLNAYHARVLELIGPRVSEAARAWLTAACAPL